MNDTYSVIPEPARRARCKTCLDEGYVDVEGCTCPRPELRGYPGMGHEPMCGVIPCPEGCADDA